MEINQMDFNQDDITDIIENLTEALIPLMPVDASRKLVYNSIIPYLIDLGWDWEPLRGNDSALDACVEEYYNEFEAV